MLLFLPFLGSCVTGLGNAPAWDSGGRVGDQFLRKPFFFSTYTLVLSSEGYHQIARLHQDVCFLPFPSSQRRSAFLVSPSPPLPREWGFLSDHVLFKISTWLLTSQDHLHPVTMLSLVLCFLWWPDPCCGRWAKWSTASLKRSGIFYQQIGLINGVSAWGLSWITTVRLLA